MSNLLYEGSKNTTVRRVQDALNGRLVGPHNTLTRPALKPLVVDGFFGPKTTAMVKEFQRIHRIRVDGIVGPVTRLHLFPYISVDGNLNARGAFEKQPLARLAPRGAPATIPVLQLVGDQPEPKPDGPFVFELSVGKGIQLPLNPWPPSFGRADQTVSIEATMIRIPKLEISGELQASKPLKPLSTDAWKWEGSVKASYQPFPKIGPITPLSPFFLLSTTALPVGIGVEAKLEILKDILELDVESKVVGYDFGQGAVKAGDVTGTLKFNLDIFFKKHPPAQP